MQPNVAIQMASTSEETPDEDSIRRWLSAALSDTNSAAEIAVRIVDEAESAELNQRFRGKDGATNVLSFPFSAVTPEPTPDLGDLVICAPVVIREAREQHKTSDAHWAHILVHGALHLLGHDHVDEDDARAMETLETEILVGLGFPAPYQEIYYHE